MVIEPTNNTGSSPLLYAKPGPFKVARLQRGIWSGNVELLTTIWYPVLANGMPDIADGPFPLVVFSPGVTQKGFSYLLVLRHLASYGFVVATWDPRSETINDSWWLSLGYRLVDIKLVIDDVEKMSNAGGEWAGLIDTQRTAVAGHYLGGGNVLMAAGAQTSFGWCTAHPELIEKDQDLTCRDFVNYQEEIARVMGLNTVPEGLWPAMGDPRVVAVIPMAPLGKFWGAEYEGVAVVKVPALIMTGSADIVVRPELGAQPIYEHLGSAKKSYVVFKNQDHEYFIPKPLYNPSNYFPYFHITTAFLLAELKGDSEAARALSAVNTTIPDVSFETTEFNNK